MTEIALPEPAPSRRGVMFYGTALIAAAVIAQTPAPVIDTTHALIMEYRTGLAAYNATDIEGWSNEQCSALADATYFPPYCALQKSLPAITTLEGAKAALLLIHEESTEASESKIIPRLTDALLAWVGADA